MDRSHIFFEAPEPIAVGAQETAQLALQGRVAARHRPLAEAANTPPGSTDPLLAWIFHRGGLKLDFYRETALKRRLPACLRKLRARSVENARALLEESPGLVAAALDSILIGVSGFFRDPTVFGRLGRQVLPELLKRRKSLRVLSAGVAAGQELYSVAMLLDGLQALDGCELVGVDCRPEAIKRALEGAYTATEVSEMDLACLNRYFEARGGNWVISPRLREAVWWRLEDLWQLRDEEWDLVLFRNVGIYLRERAVTCLWEQFFHQLRPGGVIVTGKSERPPPHLPLERLDFCVYQRSA